MASRKTSVPLMQSGGTPMTIHHSIKMRTSNRSEFDDSLLRHNQREVNRLNLELEQWEKAQKIVAKGMDKETQFFRQKTQTTNNGMSLNTSLRSSKRSSVTYDFGPGDSIGSRFIPDYQYKSGVQLMTSESAGGGGGGRKNSLPHNGASKEVSPSNGSKHGGKDSADQTESEDKKREKHGQSSTDHRKTSRSRHEERRGSEEERLRKRREERDAKRQERKYNGSHDSKTKRKESSQSQGEHHRTSEKNPTTEKRKQSSVDSSSTVNDRGNVSEAYQHQNGKDADVIPTQKMSSTSDSKLKTSQQQTTSKSSPPATLPFSTSTCEIAKSGEASKEDPKSSAASEAVTISSKGVTSSSKNVTSSSKNMTSSSRDLMWDGRRRYANVWDTLSTPRNPSSVLSVRERLQQEFKTPTTPQSSAKRGSLAKATTKGH